MADKFFVYTQDGDTVSTHRKYSAAARAAKKHSLKDRTESYCVYGKSKTASGTLACYLRGEKH